MKYIALMVFAVLSAALSCKAGSIQSSSSQPLFTGNDNSWSLAGPCGSGNEGPTPLVTAGGIGVNVYYGWSCGYPINVGSSSLSWDEEGYVGLTFSRPIQGIELNVDSFDCNFPPEYCVMNTLVYGPSGNRYSVPSEVSSSGNFFISLLDKGGPGISSLAFFVDTVDEGPFYYGGLSGVSILDPTPEPASAVLFGTAFLCLLLILKRSAAIRTAERFRD